MLLHAQRVQSRAAFPPPWTLGLSGKEIAASSSRLWDVLGNENIFIYIFFSF